jgi:hypothetical protein
VGRAETNLACSEAVFSLGREARCETRPTRMRLRAGTASTVRNETSLRRMQREVGERECLGAAARLERCI